MKKKTCTLCNNDFELRQNIDGQTVNLYTRTTCLVCSPYKNKYKKLNKLNQITLDSLQTQILNGHLLGDGFLQNYGKSESSNAHFGVLRATVDIEYLEWSASYFNDFLRVSGVVNREIYSKQTGKKYKRSEFITRCLPVFTEQYRKWYPDGKKIVPKDLVLTPLTIAVWLADDGQVRCRQHGKSVAKSLEIIFYTNCFSYDDVVFLSDQLKTLYGDRIYTQKKENNYIISITHTETAKKLLRDIDKYFPPQNRKRNKWTNSPVWE